MDLNLNPFFKKYENISAAADTLFNRVKNKHPECVKCEMGCCDCCYALFDLTLIEAIFINHHFNQKFEGKRKDTLIEKANDADRSIYKIKKNAYKASQEGKTELEILTDIAGKRVRCPLLNDQNKCDIYEFRPITCRLYGIPAAINGEGHTCGKSGFKKGNPYPTVNIDRIYQKLYEISNELVRELKSKYTKLSEVLVPISMALLTDYNETYLGIKQDSKGETPPGGNISA